MLLIEAAKSGSPIATWNGQTLNSRYDPEREANRFVEAQVSSAPGSYGVIIGETLGYLARAFTEKTGSQKCIQIFFDDSLYKKSFFTSKQVWYPALGVSIQDFLFAAIDELEVQNLIVCSWEPSSKAFPSVSTLAHEAIKRLVEIYQGSVGTTAHFGKRWIRNLVHNALEVQSSAFRPVHGAPVVIAAAGPSLHRSLNILRKLRGQYKLWALPSSLAALLDQDLIPDMVVVTDSGYYSKIHFSGLGNRRLPIAMPLSAAKGILRYALTVYALNQGSYFETRILAEAGLPSLSIPPNGTVAGTAAMLASAVGLPAIFCGLDLSENDLQTHVRPHAFEPIIADSSNRIDPEYSRRYYRVYGSRAETAHSVHPLTTYASWFEMYTDKSSSPLYRLYPTKVEIAAMKSIDEEAFTELLRAQYPTHRATAGKPLSGYTP